MNDKLFSCFLLVRIAAPILIGIILLFYLILFAIEVLYVSHIIKPLIPFFQTRNQEIEGTLKELQGIK